MTLPEVLNAIRRSLWLVLVVVLLCLAGGAGVIAIQKPVYEATSEVVLVTPSGQAVANIAYAQQIAGTYARLATTSTILDPVASKLGIDNSGDALAQNVTATTSDTSLFITITADARTARTAADLANGVATQLKASVASITPTTKSSSAPITLEVAQPAFTPSSPIRPAVTPTLLAALVAGLVLGIAVAIVRARLDTRVRDPKELEAVFDRPVLGVLPTTGMRSADPVVTRSAPTGPAAEAYRALRTNLEFLNADEDVRSIVVTSALPGEGKSTCVINLGVVMAKAGKRVLLVEADLRKPRVAAYTGIEGGIGLTDVLIGRTDLERAVQQWGPAGLSVLPAGSTPPNPSELLHSKSMRELAEQVRADYDLVLFDSPPLSAVTDAAILARLTSGAVLACALGRTKGPQTEAALDALQKAQAPVLGFVATFAKGHAPAKYVYGDPAPRAAKGRSAKGKGAATATLESDEPSRNGGKTSPVFATHRW